MCTRRVLALIQTILSNYKYIINKGWIWLNRLPQWRPLAEVTVFVNIEHIKFYLKKKYFFFAEDHIFFIKKSAQIIADSKISYFTMYLCITRRIIISRVLLSRELHTLFCIKLYYTPPPPPCRFANIYKKLFDSVATLARSQPPSTYVISQFRLITRRNIAHL